MTPRSPAALLLLLSLGCASATEFRPEPVLDTPRLRLPAPGPASPAVSTAPLDAGLARILDHAANDSRVEEHLRELCKTIGPRLTGTKRFDDAAAWAHDKFASFGLDARLEKWGEFPVAFERGPARGGMVAPEQVDFIFITNAWTAGTHGPVRGRALLEPASEAELAAAKERLPGAWVVRGPTRGDAKVRRAVREACEAAGIAGYVARGPRDGLFVMDGNQRVDAKKLPRTVEIRLQYEQHNDLARRLQDGEAVELEFDVRNEFGPGPVPCFNVVADLVGREKPDEFVIVGGHLDSWDAAEGAQDNGTGVATTIEAARLCALAGLKPRRTIRFVLFGGEEQGLFGSQGYVRDHKSELDKTSLALVHDGGGTHLAGLGTTYAMLDDFERVLAPLAKLDPDRPFQVEETAGLENSGDSDHASFLGKGVPGFFWRQSEFGYERVHHTQYDVFEAVDPQEQRCSARVVAVAAWGFAELDHLLDRTDSQPATRRRLGVQLDEAAVTGVTPDSKAAVAGWKEGDVILSIDGVETKTRVDIGAELQRGGSKKEIRLRRGEEVVLTSVDWSDEPAEKERAARAERRDAWLKARAAR